MPPKRAPSRAKRYVDPTGEFPESQFEVASWYVRNKIFLYKIFTGLFIAVDIFFISYSFYYWSEYFIVGLWADKRLVNQIVASIPDYESTHVLYAPIPIAISDFSVMQNSGNGYDFAARVRNENRQWIAHVTYSFHHAGGATPPLVGIVLPGQERFLAALGEKIDSYPADARLQVENLGWRRISPHFVSDVPKYISERVQFVYSNINFIPAGGADGISAARILFDVTNDSAYSYWEVPFQIGLYSGGVLVGVLETSLEKFNSHETRSVELRSFTPGLQADDVRILPLVNIYDRSVFISPGKLLE